MPSIPSLLTARFEAATGVDPELRPATKPQFGHFQTNVALRLANADLKSISYLSSQQEYLKMGGFDFGKMYKAVSNVKSSEASEHMEQVMGSAVFSIPHSPEVASQVLAGNLFADLGLKDSRGYRKEIEKICKEVFGV